MGDEAFLVALLPAGLLQWDVKPLHKENTVNPALNGWSLHAQQN